MKVSERMGFFSRSVLLVVLWNTSTSPVFAQVPADQLSPPVENGSVSVPVCTEAIVADTCAQSSAPEPKADNSEQQDLPMELAAGITPPVLLPSASSETNESVIPSVHPDELYPEGSLLAQRIQFDSSDQGSIDGISKNILSKEIELLRLNTRYRAESTKVGKWKPWRQAAYALAANTVINVGIDHIAFARWKYWRRPALASKPFLRKGPICLLTGHSILAAGVLIESTLDFLNDRKLKKNGFDRVTCRGRVITLRDEIDKLIAERESAINQSGFAGADRQVLDAETRVLKDVRNCAVDEFVKFSSRHSKWKTARNLTNAMILTNAATGGFIGSLGNLLAVNNRKPRLAITAGVGFAVSGSAIALTAPSARFVSTMVAKHTGKKERALTGGVAATAQSDFDKNREVLSGMLGNSGGAVADNVRRRISIYEKQNEVMDSITALAKAEAKLANKEFIEKLIVGTATGGTKIAWGTNLIVAGSAWSNTAPRAAPTVPVRINGRTIRVAIKRTKTPAQMFSRRVAQGATCQVVGSALGAIDVLQSRVRGELRTQKAKKDGKAPGQVIAKRMKTLEEAEKTL